MIREPSESPNSVSNNRVRRLFPRFSLFTLVLMTTVVAMGIALWQQHLKYSPLEDEVRRLRDEVGVLSIEDESKLHAIRVRTPDDYTWKWRLWIPEGHAYRLRCESEQVPEEGLPTGQGTIHIREPGEMWVMYQIRRDERTGDWRGSMITNFASVGSDEHEWVGWSNRSSQSSGIGTTTRISEPDENLLIERHRVSQRSSSSDIEDPARGFMIWLEPVP